MQESAKLHSELTTHSGRQRGGAPIYDGKHEQVGLSVVILHIELGPHGEGSQGFSGVRS